MMAPVGRPRPRTPIQALIAEGDAWRRSPASAGGAPGHKEWSRFLVLGSDVDLLVNLSLSDAAHGEGMRVDVPRAVVLARGPDGAWEGDVDGYAHEDTAFGSGPIGLRMGANAQHFREHRYTLDVRLARRDLAARLSLRPIARPAPICALALGSAGAIRTFAVPRLEATGEVALRGRRFALDGAPAYHDHDWGDFAWGGDFSWERAIAFGSGRHPAWTLVFRRILDGARLRALSQGVLLWRGASHVRAIQGSDVSVECRGFLPARGALRIPRAMRLAAPAAAADLPKRLEVRAARGGDVVETAFELLDLVEVAVPNEGCEPGATRIAEARAHARSEGRMRGEPFRFEGPALVELTRGRA